MQISTEQALITQVQMQMLYSDCPLFVQIVVIQGQRRYSTSIMKLNAKYY